MKKILLGMIMAVSALFSVSAYAANGDIAGTIYTTDILTQVDGKSITSYNINGETLIALEDLEQYGFNVKYDDSIRTVFINDTGKRPADFNPDIPRGEVGGIAGNYYESDISACVNGVFISAYSLDGKMAARVEDLGNIDSDSQYGLSSYLMTYSYDDEKRLLSLNTKRDSMPDTEQIKNDFINRDTQEFFGWFYDSEIPTDEGSILIGGSSGTTHGTYVYYYYLRNNDKWFVPLTAAISQYGFHDVWGHLRISDLRTEGNSLIFDGIKYDGRSGTYKMDLLTFEIVSVGEESGPDEDKSSQIRPAQSPEGKSVVTSSVNIVIDGIPVQAYSGLGAGYYGDTDVTFIEADILTHFGFSKTEVNGNILYNKTGKTDESWSCEIEQPGIEVGTIAFSDKSVSVNGAGITTRQVGDKLMIDADELWSLNFGKGTVEWELFNRYGISSSLILGVYDTETNTLSLDTTGFCDVYFDTLKETIRNLKSGIDKEYDSKVLFENENMFIMKHVNPTLESAECYLAVSEDGTYGKAYNINNFFVIYGIWYIVDFEYDGDYIVAVQKDGTRYGLNIKTFEITKMQ
jgi:hypothetical protein